MTGQRRWTADEVRQLKELAAEGWTSSRIARHLGRSDDSVSSKRNKLGLPPATDPFDADRPINRRKPANTWGGWRIQQEATR